MIWNQRFYSQEKQQQRFWGGTEFPEEEQKSEVAKPSEQAGRQCEGRPNEEVAASLKSSNFTPRAAWHHWKSLRKEGKCSDSMFNKKIFL